MDYKVKFYSWMPSTVKAGLTRRYIDLRRQRERKYAQQHPHVTDDERAKVVFVTGFPRTGTTMMKYFLGGWPGLKQTKFNPIGFFRAWEAAQRAEAILIDKSNHYFQSVEEIFATCGGEARLVCSLRDPRDVLRSFERYRENREVPRDAQFWEYWTNLHARFLERVQQSPWAQWVYLMRYEDLVQDPCEAKLDVLRWLELEAKPEEIQPTYTNQHEGEGWHDSVHEHKTIGDWALQKWRQSTPSALMQAWQEHEGAAKLMQRFGYTVSGFGEHQLSDMNCRVFTPGVDG